MPVEPNADLKALVPIVKQQMANSAGLVIHLSTPEDSLIKMRVHKNKGAANLGAPSEAMVLGPSGSSYWVDLKDGTEQPIEPLDSLIVPRTKSAAQKLKSFIAALDDLPDDHRAAMLLTLLQPNYEARVARLELMEASRQDSALHGRYSGARRRNKYPEWLSLAIPITIAVIMIAGFLLVWLAIRNVQSDLRKSPIADQPQGDGARMSADPAPAKKASTAIEKTQKAK
jgi:hypothetical protein